MQQWPYSWALKSDQMTFGLIEILLVCISQFIIGEDGSCGLIYEHAPAEGPPIVKLIDHVVETM